MPLPVGARVPDVTLVDHELRPFPLAELRGRPAVIAFFPLAFTSTCTEEMCTFDADLRAYEGLGAQVVGISVDSPFVLAKFRQELGLHFPLLSDFHREAAQAFGVLRTAPLGPGLRGVADRAVFVADADGTLRYVWSDTNPSRLPPFAEVRAAVERLVPAARG